MIKEEFNAIFRGGTGSNGHLKQSIVQVRIVTEPDGKSTVSEYRYFGGMKLAYLMGRGWQKGIVNLDDDEKYPYQLIDMHQGGEESKPIRLYNFSLDHIKYVPNAEYSSLEIKYKQLKLKYEEMREKLASALRQLHDENFKDRTDKRDIERAKHYKDVRSNYTNIDYSQIGEGVR